MSLLHVCYIISGSAIYELQRKKYKGGPCLACCCSTLISAGHVLIIDSTPYFPALGSKPCLPMIRKRDSACEPCTENLTFTTMRITFQEFITCATATGFGLNCSFFTFSSVHVLIIDSTPFSGPRVHSRGLLANTPILLLSVSKRTIFVYSNPRTDAVFPPKRIQQIRLLALKTQE
jgi:hypothetical protein